MSRYPKIKSRHNINWWVGLAATRVFFSFQWIAGKLAETPLHIAARTTGEGGEKCAQMLLKSGSDPNLSRSDGDTPLHVAASVGHVDIARLLLADAADPLIQNQVRCSLSSARQVSSTPRSWIRIREMNILFEILSNFPDRPNGTWPYFISPTWTFGAIQLNIFVINF